MECAYDNLFTDKTLAAEYEALQAKKRELAMGEKAYAFEGHVVRLTRKHYEQWFHQVSDVLNEATFLRELSALDDWLHKNPAAQKNWFFSIMPLIQKKYRNGTFLP